MADKIRLAITAFLTAAAWAAIGFAALFPEWVLP